jgi:hypothetical protein
MDLISRYALPQKAQHFWANTQKSTYKFEIQCAQAPVMQGCGFFGYSPQVPKPKSAINKQHCLGKFYYVQ